MRSDPRLIRRRAATPLLLGVALLACLSQAATASTLDEAAVRGKQIYFSGTSASGEDINAVVGVEATVLPAMALPCVNCHGYDGLGRPEGGVIPTDIRWSQLIKNYGHVHDRGRRHGPYDEASLGRTIISGVDPAGNRLDPSMPTYLMSAGDLADLVAYMKVLENDADPGIEADHVRVATLLPMSGRSAALGQAMEAALRASFADVNERGGVFGRKIELVTVPLGETPEQSLASLEETIRTRGIFALVSGYTVGLDDALLDSLRYDKLPLVGPFTLEPGDSYFDAAAFYLYPGFREQVRALADQAAEDASGAGRFVVAAPSDGQHDDLAKVTERQLRSRGKQAAITTAYARGDAASLVKDVQGEDGAEALFFFGGKEDLDALLAALAAESLAPRIYLLASLLSSPPFDAPRAFDGRIFVAHPTTSSDISESGRAYYGDLASRYGLPQGHVQAQAAAFAAARVFVEGLRRAGRDLSRIRLVDGIEALYNFETGFTPPLVYGPNERIGAKGAHILAVDLENRRYAPVGTGWRIIR